MKNTILFFLILASSALFAQKVVIKGFATDTTNGRTKVKIVVNDTLARYARHYLNGKYQDKTIQDYKKLDLDTNFVTYTNINEEYSISARLSDTLYFYSFRHISEKHAVVDVINRDFIIRLKPEICKQYVPCTDTIPRKFYVFVGEKTRVEQEPTTYYCNRISMDMEFNAEYKIISEIYGDFPKDKIRFKVFDHYGTPAFSEFRYVMLFISEYCGQLYHEKYQYFDVYPTKDGRWASPGDPYQFDNTLHNKLKIKPVKFKEAVVFSTQPVFGAFRRTEFSKAYFKIEDDKAIATTGTSVQDLFQIKKAGILKYRGILNETITPSPTVPGTE